MKWMVKNFHCLFFISLRVFGAQAECMQDVLLMKLQIPEDISKTSPQHTPDIPKISEISPKTSPQTPPDIPKISPDTSKISPKYPPDIYKITPSYSQDIPKVSPRYPKDIPKMSPRYLQYIPNIYPRYAQACRISPPPDLVWSGQVSIEGFWAVWNTQTST